MSLADTVDVVPSLVTTSNAARTAKVPFGKKGSVVEHAMPGSTTAKPVGLTSTTDADVSVKLQPLDPSAHRGRLVGGVEGVGENW